MDPYDLLRVLLDPTRLAVVGAIATRERTPADVADLADTDERTVLETLAPLLADGLVVSEDGRYRIDQVVWREVARQASPPPTPADERLYLGMTEDEAQIIARFFRGGRLVDIPSSHGKRLVVLERLALEFEPGRRYPETEVNEILGAFHADYASLRRYLVDEGLLDREQGEYWRSGGRIV